jgi:uncharacterized membrane protein YbhN (UPF0104 family)
MGGKPRRWWPVCKALIGLAILYYLGRNFARDLARPELWEEPFHLGWLLPAALLYLAGLALCALYWRTLLCRVDQHPPLRATFHAHFIGQLGKYVPGKALALVLRAALLHPFGVRPGLAGLTAFYEVLTTMAAGALVALFLLTTLGAARPGVPSLDACRQLWTVLGEDALAYQVDPRILFAGALGLSISILAPILPAVFNRLTARLARPFRDRFAAPPPFRASWLVGGLLLTGLTWPLFGLGLALALQAVPGASLPWDLPTLGWLTGVMALSYVAGFAVLFAPGALGVREAFLAVLLTPELIARHDLDLPAARGKVLLAVLLLRLAWTSAEVGLALTFWISGGPKYLLPLPPSHPCSPS